MLALAAGDPNHEENNPAEHRENDHEQKENRPTGRITTTGDHGFTAGGAGK
jgi:hypothetical protein